MCWDGRGSVKVIGDVPKYVALARLGKKFLLYEARFQSQTPVVYTDPPCTLGSGGSAENETDYRARGRRWIASAGGGRGSAARAAMTDAENVETNTSQQSVHMQARGTILSSPGPAHNPEYASIQSTRLAPIFQFLYTG